ncbi:Uncharacterized protein HZ326_20534 [Fusarium oxysporum f. sp. albedinis]|nr:FAD-binding monooxygenase moxY [Fusarium oxysporum f. sp. albedinis]KAJ0136472.1 Uncharacterized protein HZ326_20534 [Fusarium oxysporum f. sp. albedinis]
MEVRDFDLLVVLCLMMLTWKQQPYIIHDQVPRGGGVSSYEVEHQQRSPETPNDTLKLREPTYSLPTLDSRLLFGQACE